MRDMTGGGSGSVRTSGRRTAGRPPGRLLHRHLGAVVLLPLLLGLAAAMPAPTAVAADDVTATDTVAAWLTPSRTAEVTGPSESLGYVKISSPGTYVASLSAQVADRSSDPIQVASVSLLCKEESTNLDRIGTSANVFRGETFTLSTRFYFTIKKRGACFAYGSTTGLRSSSGSLSNRRVRVRATLTVAGPVSPATKESKRFVYDDADRGFSGKSFLAKPRAFTHASELETSARPGSTALVTGNVYLTSCVSGGGSRDQTTGGRQLCTPSVVRHGEAGSLVKVRLVARQYTPGGAVCATTVVPGSTVQKRISASRHHLPIAVQGAVTLRGSDSSCGNRVRAWTEVQVLSGPATVVHFPNTVTAFRPT